MGVAALAHQALGEISETQARIAELRQLWQRTGAANRVEERHLEYLEGRLALSRGGLDSALEHLKRAQSLLPPKGVEFHWHLYPHHVAIWAALGEAERAAGGDAASWFEKAAGSGSERLEQPMAYVRSLYFLARIHAERGKPAEARRYFERFLKLWGDGELDAERVREARRALG